MGVGSLAVLLLGRRVAPRVPSTLLVLVLAIAVSALLHLDDHGVAVVGDIPHALPDFAVPDVNADDIVKLITPALGVLIMSAEAVGVARQLAVKHGYRVDANRDLMALGAGNLVAGLSSGFVQSGGASQTAAADGAGGRSQLASIICAGLLLLTGAFLAPLFEHLPQATLAAIVIVAIMGFYDVGELRRFAVVRRSALLLAIVALAGVLVLGVLQGLVVAAGLSLVYVVFRLSRPAVGELGRDPRSGAWGWLDRHPDWPAPPGTLVIRRDGPLFYPNVDSVRERVLEAVAAAEPRPEVVVLDLSQSVDLDLQSVDGIADLARQLQAEGVELRLAAVRAQAAEILERAGVTPGLVAEPDGHRRHRRRGQPASPLIASPISLVPMTKQRTAMITTFSLAIHALRSSRISCARSPIRKKIATGAPGPSVPTTTKTASATAWSPVLDPVDAIAAAAPAVKMRFLGLIAESATPIATERAGVNPSIVAIHFGSAASSSPRGRPRHCLTASASSARPRTNLRMLVQVAGSPSSLALAPLETSRTIVPTTASPTTQPSRNAGPLRAAARRGEHEHDGDDRHRAERDADAEREDLADRLTHRGRLARRSGSRCGWWRCRSPRPGGRRAGSAGSRRARRGASRP